MCVLYAKFGSKVRPITFECVAMSSAVLFILRSKLLYKTLCRYGCMYFLATLVLVCRCYGDVICVGHDLNRCSGWWYVCSVNVE